MNNDILKVNDLNLDILIENKYISLLQGISFSIRKGEFVSLVGESGCGKTICSLAITKLLPKKLFKIVSGEVVFKDIDLLKLPANDLRLIRGNQITYVFQEPFSSLNPLLKIKDQMLEAYLIHKKGSLQEGIDKAKYLLSRVGITDINDRLESYPNQLSGGMLQRICIAMSLMCDPDLLIADEPTSAVDVTIQSQIISLLYDLKENYNLSILFISHDIGLVRNISDRIIVMYAGQMIESARTDRIIENPSHPYTEALLKAYPSIRKEGEPLEPIPGFVPSPENYPKGCHFFERCKYAFNECKEKIPANYLIDENDDHYVSCFKYKGIK